MSISFPPQLRNRTINLFDQQMWLWGQDVRWSAMNLLVKYGFEKHPKPANSHRSTAYSLRLEKCHVVLWAHGMYFGHAQWGGLFLKRFQLNPKITDHCSLIDPHQQVAYERPRETDRAAVATMLSVAFEWIADYETWMLGVQPLEYRQNCIANWHKQQFPLETLVTSWRVLSVNLREAILGHANSWKL
jgi:hypothetical protein